MVGLVRLDYRPGILDLDRLGHPVQEQQRSQAEAHQDALGQVAEHDQEEGRAHHYRVADRCPDQEREGMPLGHVPGHHREQGPQCGQRDVTRERRSQQHEGEQKHRVQHA
jgi:hypothetical protein